MAVQIPTIPQIEEAIRRLLPVEIPYEAKRLSLPRKGWHTVRFAKRFVTVPSLIVSLEGDISGWYTREAFRLTKVSFPKITITIPDVNIPTVALPSIKVPKIEILTTHCHGCHYCWCSTTITRVFRCPECGSSDIHIDWTADRFERYGWYICLWNAKKRLGDWGLLNWIRDALAGFFSWLGHHMLGGKGVFVLADGLSAQVDTVAEAINSGLSKMRGNAQTAINKVIGNPKRPPRGSLNRALDDARIYIQTSVNKGLADLRLSAEAGINTAINDASRALNESIDKLWRLLGQEAGRIVIIPKTRNVTASSFEVYAPAPCVCHYIAMSMSG